MKKTMILATLLSFTAHSTETVEAHIEAPNQVLKLRGHLPAEITLEGSSNYYPGVKVTDIPSRNRKTCYKYNTIDFGSGKNFQWVPQTRRHNHIAQIAGSQYMLEIPLKLESEPICQWKNTVTAITPHSDRTPYLPLALYLKPFDPNNPNHIKIPLNHTKIVCTLQNGIENCHVSPPHVINDPKSILLHEDLSETYVLNVELSR